jgi:hypothetical protein
MHAAPAHLESRLRFFELSISQIVAILTGLLVGFTWAMFVSPLHGMANAMSGAYIAAMPAVPVFVASQTEFDLGAMVIGAARWRRTEGRFTPGPGSTPHGYLPQPEPRSVYLEDDIPGGLPGLDLQALWDQPATDRSEPGASKW